ncbi:NAD(P)/FAD-dependent oxidoreductase [Capillimicrobium parvum]|uniref:N-methylproline demethylase n=1 Tax=Capillimicrobium parvum TaxID=2884022 RepID=A0A9E6XXP5_9ACTN|nr:NAD(P)/FAD-dependent oxidoreductase [Capillimicrobium parvum]UGS36008.1 putative N-methylproline demethylase [Capillimicrobium parvum]
MSGRSDPREAEADVDAGERDVAALDALWQPLRLGDVTLPNRLMTSAMTLQYGEQGHVSDRHVAFYRERAAGGVGLVFSEQLNATSLSASPFGTALSAHDERHAAGFGRIVEALEPYDTRFFAQLFAAGAVSSSTAGLDGWGPVRAPSRVGIPGGETPLPLTTAEIETIVADFARSARLVQQAGVHGVEVHGSHGWLVGQFLSPFYNRREDAHGGDVAGRCRLALEIGRAIRGAVGPGFPVGLTLTYDELIGAAGITPDDTLAQLEILSSAGVYDFFDVSIGSSHSEHHTIAPMAVAEGFSLAFAARAKAIVGERAAVFVAGRVVDPWMAARAVADGHADVVAMSRAHLADPHLVEKARSGRFGDATRCVGANVCVGRALKGEPVACVVNPVTGREGGWTQRPSRSKRTRSVVVVGAGPAGLRCARAAALAGHSVRVLERAARPGGHLRRLAQLPTRESWWRAIDDLARDVAHAGGELVLGHDASADELLAAAPDVVVVATGARHAATGASWSRPDRAAIPGLDGVVAAAGLDAALDGTAGDPLALGRRVVIVDETGGYAPLGLAERLGTAGVEVHVVTPAERLGGEAADLLEVPHVMPRLAALGVTTLVAHDVDRVEGDTVVLAGVWGGPRRELTAVDCVVLAMGREPEDRLYRDLEGRLPDVRCIGDALAPRDTAAAIFEGESTGRAL